MVGPDLIGLVSLQEEKIRTQTRTAGQPCEDAEVVASKAKGRLRPPELGQVLGTSEGARPCQTSLDLWPPSLCLRVCDRVGAHMCGWFVTWALYVY